MVRWTLSSPCTATHQTEFLHLIQYISAEVPQSVMLTTLENNDKICDSAASWSFCVTVAGFNGAVPQKPTQLQGASTLHGEHYSKITGKGHRPIVCMASKVCLPTCSTDRLLISICCILRWYRMQTFSFESTGVPWALISSCKVAKWSFLKGKL